MVFSPNLGVMLKILSWEYIVCGKIVRMPRSLRLPRTRILIFQGTLQSLQVRMWHVCIIAGKLIER